MSRLFDSLQNGDVFSNVSLKESDWFELKKELDQNGVDYFVHYHKQVNDLYESNERLQEIKKEIRELKKEQLQIEQKINYGK